jgi:hypothetical protein
LRERERRPYLTNLRERESQQAGAYSQATPPPFYNRASQEYPGFAYPYPSSSMPGFYSFDQLRREARHTIPSTRELERLRQAWQNGTLVGNQPSAEEGRRRLAYVRRDRRHPHRRSIRVQVPGRESVYYDLY